MDSQVYLERTMSLLALASAALSADERDRYTQMAGAYAELAREAATFERTHGESLTQALAA